MKTYYNILDTIKNQLLQDNDCNSVTEGSIWEIDLDKQTLAPLSHIQVNNATRQGNTYVFNISVFCMDIVDKNPKATTNKFRGNDNEQDVLNTQLAVGARLVELMERGDLRSGNFALSGEPTFESFTERFENFWAGWTLTFDVEVPNEMTICDNVIPSGDCPDATYTITDLDGNTLYTGTIASGFSNTQAINNATAVLKNTLTTTLSTTEILAEGSADITAPNAIVGLLNSEGSVIGGDSFPSGTASNMTAPDGTATNSDATYSLSVPSGGTSPLPDVTNTDSDGLPVVTPAQTPFVCTPSSPQLYQAAKVMQTGQTVNYGTGDQPNRGRDIDIFILDYTNEWGHSFRFCGLTGGYTDGTSYFDVSGVATTKALAFPDDIIFDFSARDVDSVLSYYIGDSLAYRSYNTAISLYITSVFGGLSNWYLANDIEMRNIMSVAAFNDSNHWMGHKPFEFDSSRRYFITSSRSGINIVAIEMQGMGYSIGTSLTNALLQIYVRYTTLAELGL